MYVPLASVGRTQIELALHVASLAELVITLPVNVPLLATNNIAFLACGVVPSIPGVEPFKPSFTKITFKFLTVTFSPVMIICPFSVYLLS